MATSVLIRALRMRLAETEVRLALLRAGVPSRALPQRANEAGPAVPVQKSRGSRPPGVEGPCRSALLQPRTSDRRAPKGRLLISRWSRWTRAVLCGLLLAQTMSVSGSGWVPKHPQSYRQTGAHLPDHSAAPRERHNDAGPGGVLPFALRDEAHGHPITAAADGVEPAAHALQHYDVLRALLH